MNDDLAVRASKEADVDNEQDGEAEHGHDPIHDNFVFEPGALNHGD